MKQKKIYFIGLLLILLFVSCASQPEETKITFLNTEWKLLQFVADGNVLVDYTSSPFEVVVVFKTDSIIATMYLSNNIIGMGTNTDVNITETSYKAWRYEDVDTDGDGITNYYNAKVVSYGEPKISGDELKLYYFKVEVYDNNNLVYSTNYSDTYELYKKYR